MPLAGNERHSVGRETRAMSPEIFENARRQINLEPKGSSQSGIKLRNLADGVRLLCVFLVNRRGRD
jgi:hypothetical protein